MIKETFSYQLINSSNMVPIQINHFTILWNIMLSSFNLTTESKFLDDIRINWKRECFSVGFKEKGDCDKLEFPRWMDRSSLYEDRATCRKFHRLGCYFGRKMRPCYEYEVTCKIYDSYRKFVKQVDANSISSNIHMKLCDEGYRAGASGICEDINECIDRNDTCPGSNCFNLPGEFKCCPNGAELDHQKECIFIDQCEINPCPQRPNIDDNQIWCVNYYTGRDCISKLAEGYQFMRISDTNKIQQLIDWNNKSLPRYLESSKIDITLKGESELFQNEQLIKLQLHERFNCDWKLNLDQVWSAVEDDQIVESQFVKISQQFNCFVYINGLIKPQSLAVSLTCNINDQPYYRKTIYITFKPQSNKLN